MAKQRINDLANVDGEELIRFAMAWSGLGWEVMRQVQEVLREGFYANANPKAIRAAQKEIGGFCEEIDIALEEFLQAETEREEDRTNG